MKVNWKIILMGLLVIAAVLTVLKFNKTYLADLDSKDDRTNILLMGIAGVNHEGKDLTDSLIFISASQKNGGSLISLPRDIWIASIRAKINTAYHYGGFPLAKSVVEEILGQSVQYVVLIDFNSFSKIIDVLGGIEVWVDREFDDYQYPIPGKENDNCLGDKEYRCRYEHIHFDAGLNYFDGETALKFVRSRNAEGEEGTDFARSARQQKVIIALRNKMLALQTIFNPSKMIALAKILPTSVFSDIPFKNYFGLAKLGLKFIGKEIRVANLEGLINPPISKKYDNQWVLVPQSGNWQTIQKQVEEFLK